MIRPVVVHEVLHCRESRQKNIIRYYLTECDHENAGTGIGSLILEKSKTSHRSRKIARHSKRGKSLLLLQASSGSWGILDRILRLEHWRFRRGLRRAARIGAFFADRASQTLPGNWRVSKIDAGFKISVSGDFLVVTVGALAGVYLNLVRLEEAPSMG